MFVSPQNSNPNPQSDGIGTQDHWGVMRVEPFLNEIGALIKEAPESFFSFPSGSVVKNLLANAGDIRGTVEIALTF